MKEPASDSVRAIDRAFAVLEELRLAGGPATLSELAEQVGLPQPTVHRILRTLVAGGYVHQVANRRYTLGTGLIGLARGAGINLGSSLRPLLVQAVDATQEAASLAILDQDEMRYIASVSSNQAVRVFTQVGNRASLHSTGVGKAVLAAMPEEEARAMIGRLVLTRLTPTTITDHDRLLAEVDQVRRQGFAIDNGEHEIGVRCVATPVPGQLPLAVSISGPEHRMSDEYMASVCLPAALTAAGRIADACEQMEASA